MTNYLKASWRTEIIPVLLIILAVASSFYFYANFPEQVPIHWNVYGQVDGWSSRAFGAFFFPALITGMYLLFFIFPYLDPKKERYEQFAKAYHIFKGAIVAFVALLYFYTSLIALGHQLLPVNVAVPVGIGVLFIIIGNYLGKVKANWFMGIRTPWTLSSEEVWNKSNRLGGKIFIIMGLFSVLGFWLPSTIFFGIFITMVIVGSLIPIVYSYWLWRKLNH
ncbi:MAG: SdpI family protein [Candidatus Buchananbacteria bacterium]